MSTTEPFFSLQEYLQLINRFTCGCRDISSLEDLDTLLREQVFSSLDPVSTEIYFPVEDLTDFRPPFRATEAASFRGNTVPKHIPRQDPWLNEFFKIARTLQVNTVDQSTPPFLSATGNLCHLLIQIRLGAEIRAILYAGWRTPQLRSDELRLVLETIGALIGSQIQRMDEISTARNSVASLETSEQIRQALYEISEQTHIVSSEEDLFASMHQIVNRFLDARNFFIALRKERNGEQFIHFVYYFDECDPHFQGMEFKIDPAAKSSMSGFLLKSGQTVLLGPDDFDQFCQDNDINPLGTKAYSLMGSPFYLDHLSGVVVVQSYREVIYTEKDKELLRYMARHIGDALARRKTIADIRNINELFSSLMCYSPVYVYIKEVTETDSLVVQASQNYRQMLGKPVSEIIGKNMFEIFPADYAEKVTLEDRAIVMGGVPVELEDHLLGRTYATIKFPIRQSERNLLAGFTIDITERKLTEEALRDSERKYRVIFERSPLALISFDSEGTIVDFNDKFVEMMGSSREKLLGINTARQSSPKMREAIKKALAGETATFEDLYTSITGGRTAFLRAKFSPVLPGRSPTEVIATLEDLTELKKHEAEQHKLEKLESLGILAGGIAHDFNNILTGIMANISFAQVLIEQGHKANKPLAEAEKASTRAAELARQLLTFARGGEPNKKVVSVRHLLREAVSLMLRGSNVKAVLNIPDLLQSLIADEGQISQVLNNLILNATQAMPEGGTLTISADNVLLPTENRFDLPAGPYISIEMKDEGCGIPEENLGKIFDPYFSTKVDGTGLGLASTHSIIIRHGGNITVHSEVGKGTTIIIHLPSIDISHVEHPQVASPNSKTTHAGTILVMDDEEMIRAIATAMLRHLGYEVVTCASGEEAVELYRNSVGSGLPFRAVILDLTIPGGFGGKEAAEQILAIAPEANLIVSSGYSNDPIVANFKKFGFRGAIAKPYNIHEFEQVLNSLPGN